MATLYDTLISAITAHWKAHDNAYPQAIKLTPIQLQELNRVRRLGMPLDQATDFTKFLGVPVVESPGTPGVLVTLDGTEQALQL